MISKVADDLQEAGSIRINQMVYDLQRMGVDVTVLSLGEAFFDIPIFDFSKIDFVKGYHYSDSRGLPRLREKISDYYFSRYQARVNYRDQILISSGSKLLLYISFLGTLNPGDEVLVPEPHWVSYPEQIKLCHAVPRTIPYWVSTKDFESYFTPKTKMVVLNNPNNPAGFLYSRTDLENLHKICRQRGAILLVDEAYSDFCLGGNFYSATRLDPTMDHIIVINSLSKNMGMSGWRIGYLMTQKERLCAFLKINQHLMTCAPTVLQSYCEHYFDDILNATLPQVQAVVEKRNRLLTYINQIGLRVLPGASTFYFFLDIHLSQQSSLEFAERLLSEHQIATVPGHAYGQSTDGFIRVGVGTESEENIRNALMLIRSFWGDENALGPPTLRNDKQAFLRGL